MSSSALPAIFAPRLTSGREKLRSPVFSAQIPPCGGGPSPAAGTEGTEGTEGGHTMLSRRHTVSLGCAPTPTQ